MDGGRRLLRSLKETLAVHSAFTSAPRMAAGAAAAFPTSASGALPTAPSLASSRPRAPGARVALRRGAPRFASRVAALAARPGVGFLGALIFFATVGVTGFVENGGYADLVARHGAPRDILARVATLPVSMWSYQADDPSIRHIGPTAQDFYATFNVGQDDTHLAALDTNGVALAAIQGLNQVVQDGGRTLEDCYCVRELEVVEISQHDNIGVRIGCDDCVDEVVLDLGLMMALHFTDTRRRLEVPEQRIVATLRVEVVGDHKQVVAVEQELARQWLAAGVERRVGRINTTRAVLQLCAGAGAHHRVGGR